MRNYIEFWSGCLNIGGNFYTFVAGTQAQVMTELDAYQAGFGGTIVWTGRAGYLLCDKDNLVNLLRAFTSHYPSAMNQHYNFFQDSAAQASESPRDTWSHGE